MPKEKHAGIFIIPLKRVYWGGSRRNRGQRAVKFIRRYLERQLGGKVILDPLISVYIYKRKIEKPPRYIAVRFMRIDEGVFKASLAI
ncbi:MAG TPA: 50S ribosomal protein L31e, partial [Ignisphaera sp.]|nr:50S ribosomal protein L31e [Ignisphaera sp.]